jgi:hypothetical protein
MDSNNITVIENNLFDNLYKLELIDLSRNSIFLIKNFSFNKLPNLRDLYLGENSIKIIETNCCNHMESMENLYISKSILNNYIKQIIIGFVHMLQSEPKNKVINRNYYKSFNLIATNEYDCELTLFFIRHNIHYNLKSDFDFYNYLKYGCDDLMLNRSF